jgi:hypothetical protein
MPIAEPNGHWARAQDRSAGRVDRPEGRSTMIVSIRLHAERQRPFNLIGIVDVAIGIDHDHSL